MNVGEHEERGKIYMKSRRKDNSKKKQGESGRRDNSWRQWYVEERKKGNKQNAVKRNIRQEKSWEWKPLTFEMYMRKEK